MDTLRRIDVAHDVAFRQIRAAADIQQCSTLESRAFERSESLGVSYDNSAMRGSILKPSLRVR